MTGGDPGTLHGLHQTRHETTCSTSSTLGARFPPPNVPTRSRPCAAWHAKSPPCGSTSAPSSATPFSTPSRTPRTRPRPHRLSNPHRRRRPGTPVDTCPPNRSNIGSGRGRCFNELHHHLLLQVQRRPAPVGCDGRFRYGTRAAAPPPPGAASVCRPLVHGRLKRNRDRPWRQHAAPESPRRACTAPGSVSPWSPCAPLPSGRRPRATGR